MKPPETTLAIYRFIVPEMKALLLPASSCERIEGRICPFMSRSIFPQRPQEEECLRSPFERPVRRTACLVPGEIAQSCSAATSLKRRAIPLVVCSRPHDVYLGRGLLVPSPPQQLSFRCRAGGIRLRVNEQPTIHKNPP